MVKQLLVPGTLSWMDAVWIQLTRWMFYCN